MSKNRLTISILNSLILLACKCSKHSSLWVSHFLVSIDVNDRPSIHPPSTDKVVDHADQRSASKHYHSIIHVLDCGLYKQREEADHSCQDAEQNRNQIDRDALTQD
jgi:hypothetical protein